MLALHPKCKYGPGQFGGVLRPFVGRASSRMSVCLTPNGRVEKGSNAGTLGPPAVSDRQSPPTMPFSRLGNHPPEQPWREPVYGPGVHDRNRLPGVHVGLPQDGPARFRPADDQLRTAGEVRGVEEPEALSPAVPQPGDLLRARHRILDDLVAAVRPRRMMLTVAFTPRGGITTTVTATFIAEQK